MSMRLRVLSPLATILDRQDIVHVQARDDSGAFGIKTGHAPFLTALPPTVVTVHTDRDHAFYIAVAGGILRVDRDGVLISSPDAAVGEELAPLAARVTAEKAARQQRQTEGHAQERKLQATLIHHLLDSVTSDRAGDGGVP